MFSRAAVGHRNARSRTGRDDLDATGTAPLPFANGFTRDSLGALHAVHIFEEREAYMKAFVRLTLSTLLALLVIPRITSAQPAPPQPPPPPNTAGQPPPPPPDATQPAPPTQASPTLPLPPPDKPTPAPAKADPTTAKGVEWTSLRLMRDKGMISEAEYASAVKDLTGIGGPTDPTTLVVSKLKLSFFGYTQFDITTNSTQSCLEYCSNFLIAKKGTYRGDHPRTTIEDRDTRFGLRFAAPEEHGIRASGLIETDFYGPIVSTEGSTYTNPVLRIRHSYFKLETPVVDLTIGQTGNLFGWGSTYLVLGGQFPGLPGQMYQRTPQLRVSKPIKSDAVIAEPTFAIERPVQQDSGIPELAAGVRLLFPKWTGYHTYYLVTSVLQPASIAVVGDFRGFRIPAYEPNTDRSNFRAGGGISIDTFLPIIPATKTSRDNALAFTGELVIGAGTQDMYTALGAAGTVIPPIPPAMAGGTPTPYVPNFDPGFAAYRADGHLELLKWTSYMAGLEYYPPGVDGRMGFDLNYGHMQSKNTKKFATPANPAANIPYGAGTRESEDFFAAGGYFDATKQVRFGIDFGLYNDNYVDGSNAKNYSVMTSGWLFF
jgi:hypothetical protein